MKDDKLALFLMLGQSATKALANTQVVSDGYSLKISETADLAQSLPVQVRLANEAAEGYKLFFVFENYLREFIIDTLSNKGTVDWYAKLPKDVQDEIKALEETEEVKSWMALGSREKSALMTYPQLIRAIDHCWKDDFSDIVRDKTLLQEARMISHLRNTLCHMTPISDEEISRVKQVMKDWFRIISP